MRLLSREKSNVRGPTAKRQQVTTNRATNCEATYKSPQTVTCTSSQTFSRLSGSCEAVLDAEKHSGRITPCTPLTHLTHPHPSTGNGTTDALACCPKVQAEINVTAIEPTGVSLWACNFADGICAFRVQDQNLIETLKPVCEAKWSPIMDVPNSKCEVNCEAAFQKLFATCGFSDPTGPYRALQAPIPEGEEMTPGGRRPLNHTACCHHPSEPGEPRFRWAALTQKCHCKYYQQYEFKLAEVYKCAVKALKGRSLANVERLC
eukprot:3628998-Pyramimonas_sp.AAC.1